MGFHIEGGELVRASLAEGKTSLTIPEGVHRILPGAFKGAEALTRLHLPSSMDVSARPVLAKCTALEYVEIGDDCTYYRSQDGCLYYRRSPRLVFVPPAMESLTLAPYSVREIVDRAAVGCTRLTELVIPEGLTSVGMYAFEGCTGLCSVQLPETLRYLNDRAFYKCASLQEITLPEKLQSIGEEAFFGCGALRVSVPMSVTNIRNRAFERRSVLSFACTEGTFVYTLRADWDLPSEGRSLLGFLHTDDWEEREIQLRDFCGHPAAAALGRFLRETACGPWYIALMQEKADELIGTAFELRDPAWFHDILELGGVSPEATERLLQSTLTMPEFYAPLLHYKEENGMFGDGDALQL